MVLYKISWHLLDILKSWHQCSFGDEGWGSAPLSHTQQYLSQNKQKSRGGKDIWWARWPGNWVISSNPPVWKRLIQKPTSLQSAMWCLARKWWLVRGHLVGVPHIQSKDKGKGYTTYAVIDVSLKKNEPMIWLHIISHPTFTFGPYQCSSLVIWGVLVPRCSHKMCFVKHKKVASSLDLFQHVNCQPFSSWFITCLESL